MNRQDTGYSAGADARADPLVRAVRGGLADLADAEKAPAMRRYMKSAMPFHGVPAPARRRMGRTLFAEYPLGDAPAWQDAARELWHGATYREERYVAIDLTGDKHYSCWQTPEVLPLYDDMIVTGAWWDFVDEIAIHRIGPLLRDHPHQMDPIVRAWASDPDRWRRRSAVICQIGAKHSTDLDLLTYCVEANVADPDFFLRKGIGWALRQQARTDADWVRSFVAAHPSLSTLSVREALKHLR